MVGCPKVNLSNHPKNPTPASDCVVCFTSAHECTQGVGGKRKEMGSKPNFLESHLIKQKFRRRSRMQDGKSPWNNDKERNWRGGG